MKNLALVITLLLALPSQAKADPDRSYLYDTWTKTLTYIEAGLILPRATGVNNSGQVVGESGWSGEHGFLYDHGAVTTISVPPNWVGNWLATRPAGINNDGDIVGWFSGPGSGFLFSGGTYFQLSSLQAHPHGINDSDVIVGGDSTGIISTGGVARIVTPYPSRLLGLNNTGLAVGDRAQNDPNTSFLYDIAHGTSQFLLIPCPFWDIRGITDDGTVVGNCNQNRFTYFSSDGVSGYKYNIFSGDFSEFKVGYNTNITGVSSDGRYLVGLVPEPTSLLLLGCGLGLLAWTRKRTARSRN